MSEISEQCGCGADFRIDDPQEIWTTAAIDEAVLNWRTTHIHAPVAEAGRCTEYVAPMSGGDKTIFCTLRFGHTGAHEDNDGAMWFRRELTQEEA